MEVIGGRDAGDARALVRVRRNVVAYYILPPPYNLRVRLARALQHRRLVLVGAGVLDALLELPRLLEQLVDFAFRVFDRSRGHAEADAVLVGTIRGLDPHIESQSVDAVDAYLGVIQTEQRGGDGRAILGVLVAVERFAQPDGLVGDGVRLCLRVILFVDPRRPDAKSTNIEDFAWLDAPEVEAPVLEERVGVRVRDLRGI